MTSLTQWNPFETTLPGFPKLEEVFQLQRPLFAEGEFTPTVNVTETPEAYVVRAEVPGIPAEEIKVDLSGDRITISGEKKQEERREEEQRHIYERRYGSFSRSFSFPSPVDADEVEAESEDGVLTITVAKDAGGNGRRIEIKSKQKKK